MKLKIKKEHNKQVVVTENNSVLGGLKTLIIEAHVGEVTTETVEVMGKVKEGNLEREINDNLMIKLISHNDLISIYNNKRDNITLDLIFGGEHELSTFGSDDELNKRIIFSKNDEILGRIQKFRCELSTEVTYGKAEMELILT